MALTQNPLNEFNSFSYHHFLILCNSTATADKLVDADALFRLVSGTELIDGAKVLVNPLVSNRFVIQEAEWTSMLAANYVEFGSAVWSGGSLKIIEPRGMSFLNELYDVVNELGTSVESCVWVLKTIFIGDTGVGDGPQRFQYLNYVKPSTLIMSDVQINFDESGGQYEFQFTLADAGAGAYKHVDGALFNTDTTVNLAGGGSSGGVTIQQALLRLEQHVNATYDKNFKIAQKTVNAQAGVPPFERIQVKIAIPEELKKPEYIVTNTAAQGMGANGASASITLAPGTPLTDAIQEVLKSSPNLMNEVTSKGSKKIFHVVSSVVQNPEGTDPRRVYTFSILPKQITTIETEQEEQSAQEEAIANGNYLEFDYMYTGKNIDVLEFQMRMNTGILFFNTILTRSTMRDDRSEGLASEYLNSSANQQKFGSGKGNIYYPSTISSADNADKPSPTQAQLYDQLFQQYTMVDNVMTTIKIRGNPRLLNDITPTKEAIADAVAAGVPDGEGLAQKWATMPVRCKVNVRMPKNGDYDTIEDFWFRGLYRVMSVKNMFSGGEFIQELELITELDGVMGHVAETGTLPNTEEQFTTLVGEPKEIEARIRAFIQMIRYCEGTTGDRGYSTLFGGGQFSDFSDHPDTVVKTPNYSSSAAGAYQILTKTWRGLQGKYSDLTNFEPQCQDKACYYLIQNRGALGAIRANKIETAISQCRKEWASLPNAGYGQPQKTLATCLAVYQRYLEQELAGQTTLKIELGQLA